MLINIQHEETGRLQEWPVDKPIPRGWATVSEPFNRDEASPNPMTDSLETLHELKRAVDMSIDCIDIHPMFPIRDETCDYTEEDFDFIIGNFGVKRIRGERH